MTATTVILAGAGGSGAAWTTAAPLLPAGLATSSSDFGSAIRAALLCAAGLMLLALVIAVGDLRRSRRLPSAGVLAPAARRPH